MQHTTLTEAQRAILADISDPWKRDLLRRLFEKAADVADQPALKAIPLVRDPEAERVRAKWRS